MSDDLCVIAFLCHIVLVKEEERECMVNYARERERFDAGNENGWS